MFHIYSHYIPDGRKILVSMQVHLPPTLEPTIILQLSPRQQSQAGHQNVSKVNRVKRQRNTNQQLPGVAKRCKIDNDMDMLMSYVNG